MRQVQYFLKRIHIRTTTKEYYRSAFLAKLNDSEILPLEDILGVGSEEGSSFDAKVDNALDARAKHIFEEKKWLTTNFK